MKHVEFFREITNYPNFTQYQIFLRFYEELKFCSNEFIKIIDIVRIFLDTKNLHKTSERNFELVKLNFNFLLGILNLFQFDQKNPIERQLIEVYLIKLYGYVIEEFERLRKKWPIFFYFSKEEEARYIEAIRIVTEFDYGCGTMSKEASMLSEIKLFPSKVGFFYLRHLRYYISKVNKYIFKTNTDNDRNKLSFYVSNNLFP